MAVELAPISGAIELKDDYTSVLSVVSKELFAFTEGTQKHFAAVAAAGTLVAATFTGIAVAAKELGERGSDILDVEATLEQFTGGARDAAAVMEQLREGTLGTITNFQLTKDAAKLLSAGVKLTADDFGTLSQAAFVLQNRGLGSTKEMLDLVSDALVTGRTRSLAMAVGVIDAGNAEAEYAKKLGTTVDMLSDTAKVEAKRIAIMDMLREAVAKAGEQERDFGEQLEAARTFVGNYIDELSKAVAQSPVLAAGMKAVGDAIAEAFGGDSQESIQTIVGIIENAAIVATDFALAMVETARVVHTAWAVLQTVVLGVMTGISELVSFIPGMNDRMKEFTASLAEQTAEAYKGVVGASEFDKTLDALGGTIFRVRDAMVEAKNKTREHSDTLDIAAENSKKLAHLQAQLSEATKQRAIDAGKLADMEKKSLETIEALTSEHFAHIVSMTGTSTDARIAAIEARFQKEVAALDELNPKYKEHYAALRQRADDALEAVGSGWVSVRDKSLEALRQQADAARRTYNDMIYSGLHFTRDVLDEQLRKTEELEDAARGMGQSYADAMNAAAAATKAAADEQARLAAELKKAQEARSAGGSFQINRANLESSVNTWGVPISEAVKMAERGFSFQEIIAAWQSGKVREWVPQGPRIPGFAEGGTVDIKVGERGPEVARVPLGTQVFPNGMRPGNTSTVVNNNTFNVNGDAITVARKIQEIIMRDLKSGRQFSAA